MGMKTIREWTVSLLLVSIDIISFSARLFSIVPVA